MSMRMHHICIMLAGSMLLAAGSARAVEVIVDNADSGFTTNGSWTTATASNDYGSDYRYRAIVTSSSRYARWTPTLPTAGDYDVYAYWPTNASAFNNVQYTISYNGGTATVYKNQALTPGTWVLLGRWNFLAGSAGYVQLSNQGSDTTKVALADAVKFVGGSITLTMAVSPAGGGTTTPAIGGPYPYNLNDVVSISATPAAGYTFSTWQVSAGSNVANPTAASTTVTMDTAKTVTAVFTPPVTPQFRAVWADAFHEGFKSKTQIDNMISRAVTGRYNAIVAEVAAYYDNGGSAHGAYWNSNIVPKAPDITLTGLPNGDPLAYLVQQAHANGIEVHCWLLAFRVSSVWPPAGNSYLAAHPEFLMVPRANMGAGPATVGGSYVFDPGSPDVQEYLMSLIRELVANYEIDGVNYDYIRYTQTDAGYPASNTYGNSGLKRFQRITGRTDTPLATGDTQWNDFRRQTITEVVRRTRVEMAAITSNPRQPLRFTCALITTGNVTSTDFTLSNPYKNYLSNWGLWLEKGYLDGGMPMCYDREYDASQAQWYRNWVNACVGWRGQRHMYTGQANYLNTMADSITQLQYAYSAGADGTVNYSYASTVDSDMNNVTETDWTWYNYVSANLFTQPAPLPTMPWRNPATATEGTLWGQVTRSGVPVDDAAVQVGSEDAVKTDGNGIYVATMIPAGAVGTGYTVTASKDTDNVSQPATVYAGDLRRLDLAFPVGPVFTQQPVDQNVCPGMGTTFTVVISGTPPITYQWRKNGVDLSDTGHYSGTATATLTVSNTDSSDVADYLCVATDPTGSNTSNSAHLSLGPDGDGDGQGDACDNCVSTPNSNQADTDNDNVGDACDTCPDTIPGVQVDANGCPPLIPEDFDRDGDVDATDFDVFQACASGAVIPVLPGCENSDLDHDGDADQEDFGVFQRCFSGADLPVNLDCEN